MGILRMDIQSIPQNRTEINLFIRHRWCRMLDRGGIFLCLPRARLLYESTEPVCYGCRSIMHPDDIKGWPEKYAPTLFKDGVPLGDDIRMEKLGVRLDLLFCEIQLQQAKAP